ncbi:Predicted transglutaminase-like cysteine proteinase [Aureimonas jatrophae]|uniref:Predicted transglutaminase-like cysteine proteinase n=2 Tax=Aureimonas jatrophae TaxID=1166073 RepID=A0A1H0NLS7_9HYPH|nr:Predicted transglutaminase-like cysteine proteinase [Aureimonas jatrophae]
MRSIGLIFGMMLCAVAPLDSAYAGPVLMASVSASPPHSALRMSGTRETLPPFAFSRFCVTNPDDCRRYPEAEVNWSGADRALVTRINTGINRSITPRNDIGDDWEADVAAGDCEDFALTKRRALIASGIPASALRIAVARTAAGEGHAVLVIRTTSGDLVLDNRTNRITPWRQTDLTWLKVSSAEDPRIWLVVR